jgi:hypothetical protein
MKERPILFSAPMVRATLAGNKTMTRRVVKPPRGLEMPHEPLDQADWDDLALSSPYGQPGDRLWVRETWGVVSHAFNEYGDSVAWTPDRPAKPIRDMRFGSRGYYTGHVIYAADGHFEWADDDDGELRSAWKPSIHMPRIASRITLEVTGVRVERVQEISEADAIAEGVHRIEIGSGYPDHFSATPATWTEVVEQQAVAHEDPRLAFRDLWDGINEQRGFGWLANPYVWVIEFKRIPQEQSA